MHGDGGQATGHFSNCPPVLVSLLSNSTSPPLRFLLQQPSLFWGCRGGEHRGDAGWGCRRPPACMAAAPSLPKFNVARSLASKPTCLGFVPFLLRKVDHHRKQEGSSLFPRLYKVSLITNVQTRTKFFPQTIHIEFLVSFVMTHLEFLVTNNYN